MPVTDRLLQKLQETLGEGPMRDLVVWVNEAAIVNRSEVRELADLYLSRFDERLERRFAEQDTKLERRFAELGAKVEHRLAEQDVTLERRLVGIEHEMTVGFAAVRVEMADRLSAPYRDLLRWLFIFWAGTIIPLAGLMIARIKL